MMRVCIGGDMFRMASPYQGRDYHPGGTGHKLPVRRSRRGVHHPLRAVQRHGRISHQLTDGSGRASPYARNPSSLA